MTPSETFDMTDRVAMVTGSGRGMGQAMALAFAGAGADVVLVDRDTESNQQTASEIEALGRRALPVTCDVSDCEAIEELYRTIDDEFGRIDVVGNVAGEGVLAEPVEMTREQLLEAFEGLVIGRYVSCREAGKRMLAAGRGSIINIGSLASLSALGRRHLSYSMAMGAVVQMTRELSTEWSGFGVRVNAILPAQVINPGLTQRMQADPHLERMFLGGIPAGRMGVPDDIRGLSLLLGSDAGSWITGALIPMDGGNLAMNAGGTPGWLRAESADGFESGGGRRG
jgi:NAD(P)-dependent dehydrogenase (short-subunit alcohol dehydrogenase family)